MGTLSTALSRCAVSRPTAEYRRVALPSSGRQYATCTLAGGEIRQTWYSMSQHGMGKT